MTKVYIVLFLLCLISCTNTKKNIDMHELKALDMKLPDKRDKLIEVIKKLKEDDNPVLMIVRLK